MRDRGDPLDPFEVRVKLFLVLLNLILWSPYLFLVLYAVAPDLLTLFVSP